MGNNVFSIIIKCWYDTQTGATHLQVVRTDTAEQEMSLFATDATRFGQNGMTLSSRRQLIVPVGEPLRTRFDGSRCKQGESHTRCADTKKAHFLFETKGRSRCRTSDA